MKQLCPLCDFFYLKMVNCIYFCQYLGCVKKLSPMTAGAPAITLTPPEQSDTYKLHTQLKFQFQINSLSATLYSGESTLVSEGRKERERVCVEEN